jgi:hypothetical protein
MTTSTEHYPGSAIILKTTVTHKGEKLRKRVTTVVPH